LLGDVEIAILAAGDVVRPAHAGPHAEEVAIRREYLDALVGRVVGQRVELKTDGIGGERTARQPASLVGPTIATPLDSPQDTEFPSRIVVSALKIAASSGECGLKRDCPRLAGVIASRTGTAGPYCGQDSHA
jgi:hypothetical protein